MFSVSLKEGREVRVGERQIVDAQQQLGATERENSSSRAMQENNGDPYFATRRVAARRRDGLQTFDAWQLCIWVYRDQKAHVVNGEALGGPRSTPRAAANWQDYGTPIDGGGNWRAYLDPAAEAVSAFVHTLADRRLLVSHAVRGEAPAWIPDSSNDWRPVWRDGRPDYTARGKRRPDAVLVMKHPDSGGKFCPIAPRYSTAQVGWARQAYGAWWRIVMAIEAHFIARPSLLPGIDLVPFRALEAPWLAPEPS